MKTKNVNFQVKFVLSAQEIEKKKDNNLQYNQEFVSIRQHTAQDWKRGM